MTSTDFLTLMKKNTGWLYAGEILPRLAGLFIVPIWSARVAPEEYARWVLVLTTTELLLGFSTLGFATFFTKVLYRYRDRRAQEYFALGALVVLLVTVISAAGMAACSPVLARLLLGAEARSDIFAWLAIYLACAQLTNLALLYLGAQVRFGAHFLITTLRWIGNAGFLLWGLLVWRQGFYSWVWAWMGTELVLVPVSWYHLRHALWPRFRKRMLRFAFRFSFPTMVMDVLAMAQSRVGRYVVSFSGLGAQVGLYGVAQNFARNYGAVVRPAKLVALRALGHALEDDPHSPHFVEFFHGFSCLALGVAFLVALFLGDLLKLVVSPAYHGASAALAPLVFGLYLEEVSSLYHSLLFRYFKVWSDFFSTLITFPIVVIVTLLLVRPFGFLGAALAQLAGGIAMVVFAHRYATTVTWRPFRFGEKLLFTFAALGLTTVAEWYDFSVVMKGVMAVAALVPYWLFYWRRRDALFPVTMQSVKPMASLSTG